MTVRSFQTLLKALVNRGNTPCSKLARREVTLCIESNDRVGRHMLEEKTAPEQIVGDTRDGRIIIPHCTAIVPRGLDSTSVALHQPVKKERKKRKKRKKRKMNSRKYFARESMSCLHARLENFKNQKKKSRVESRSKNHAP